MIRLLIKDWTKEQKMVLRNILVCGYHDAVNSKDNTITKAFANALSWLEDEIAKM